jgi:hypothetical protein
MNAPREATLDASPSLPSWPEANQQWLGAAMARMRDRFAQTTAAGTGAATMADISATTPLPDNAQPGFTPALLSCARAFGLSPFEREVLLLTAGIELDPALRQSVAGLHAGSNGRASFALALGMLAQPHWDALSPDAALRYWLLVEPEPDPLLTEAALCIDERILHFIMGIGASDVRLRGIARYIAPGESASLQAHPLLARMAMALRTQGERGPLLVLHNEPPDAAALRDGALAAIAALQRPALWIASADLPGSPGEIALLARLIDREGALNSAIVVLDVGNTAEAASLSLAGQLRCAILWLGLPSPDLHALPLARHVLRIEWPALDARQAFDALIARWRLMANTQNEAPSLAGPANGEIEAALRRASQQFRLGPTALDNIVESLATLKGNERANAVWAAARASARGGLDTLAQRIDSGASFDDLVLPSAQLGALRDISRHLMHRERVYRDWGFGDRQARGQGLTALFAGESGTGKTLAAEAIAAQAELDLYRVDLATLVSKYIGETEKNLKRLFDAAESSGAVLLFDEADALFGKRSEVRDSHDRYANIEVAYLLQRVETYRGLAILTTNMKSALDRAFLRRIRFVVTFPFPDLAAREQLWRRQFPERAPMGDVDFAALARLHVAGGNIRSIVLNAAFKAADGPGCIGQALLLDAARAEYAKLERSFNDGLAGGSA